MAGFRDRRGQMLFIDARKLGRPMDRTHRELTDEDIAGPPPAFLPLPLRRCGARVRLRNSARGDKRPVIEAGGALVAPSHPPSGGDW